MRAMDASGADACAHCRLTLPHRPYFEDVEGRKLPFCVARGGKLDQMPRDQPWGMRDFALTDPDGFKITIGAQKR